jgi:hypothetical protein
MVAVDGGPMCVPAQCNELIDYKFRMQILLGILCEILGKCGCMYMCAHHKRSICPEFASFNGTMLSLLSRKSY